MKEKFKKYFNAETLLYILTGVAVILLIGFFWSSLRILSNETLAFRDDSVGFNNVFEIFQFPIALLIALLAVITLHVTIQRLIQTSKQLDLISEQISSPRQPEIFINNQVLYMLTKSDATYIDKMFVSPSTSIETSNIIITNVGLGTATHVNLEFKYDLNIAVELIQKVNEPKWFEISHPAKDLIKIKNVNSEYEEFFHIDDPELKKYTNYITALREIGYSTIITTPKSYFFLFTIFLSLLGYELEEIESAFQGRKIERGIREFPKLFLDITYSDIGMSLHHKTFQIDIEYQKFVNPFYGNFRTTENEFELIVKPFSEPNR